LAILGVREQVLNGIYGVEVNLLDSARQSDRSSVVEQLRPDHVQSPRQDQDQNQKIDAITAKAKAWMEDQQAEDGSWSFELEADVTIPAEYILLNHFLGEIDDEVEAKLAEYIRRTQGSHGGWPLYHDGDLNMSASVKAYLALKLTGEDPDAPHMTWALNAIRNHGGAEKVNVFTLFALALFGQVPWSAVPVMRVEAMLLPKWAVFHIDKVSYWSRTVMVPLLVLAALRPQAKNPRNVDIKELFLTPPDQVKTFLTNPTGSWLGRVMLGVDKLARYVEPFVPNSWQQKGIDKAIAFVEERLNGEDGLGGIFPAMANALMMYDTLGYDKNHEKCKIIRKSIDKLLILHDDWGYCQPCLSPVWDTGLGALAMLEAGVTHDDDRLRKACEWLVGRQITEVKGDWTANRGDIRPGGWAFQYWNDYYPDVDDTAVVVMALHRADSEKYKDAIDRGAEWIIGMQSKNGGWGAFDADNEHYFLQNIPFADHGALLDPPTADVSARCISMLAQLGYEKDHPVVKKGLRYLRREQEDNGSWFGRWGNNYVYGTWSVLNAYCAIGLDVSDPHIQRAKDWLISCQRPDGGWGEDCATYWQHRRDEVKTSTPSQTSWAMLGLMAVGEVDNDATRRGVEYLLEAPRNGKWVEEYFNAVGFPRIFYLRYHGYSGYFPLWTLARYRNLMDSNDKFPKFGM
jgi:squalene-hopene/tetraprenyl-beta-curcumene cyclase